MNALARFIVTSWYCFILVIGITSLFYDFRSNKLKQTRILQVYTVLVNFITLFLVPFYCYYGMQYMDFVREKPLLAVISRFTIVVQCLLICYTLISRYSNDKDFFRLIENIQELAENWISINEDTSYMHLFYLKYITMVYQNVTILFGVIYIMHGKREFVYKDLLLNLYFLLIWNFLQGTVFCFYLVLLHILRCLKNLNESLGCLMQGKPKTSLKSYLDLVYLLLLHRKMHRVLLQLIQLYRLHIVTYLLTFMMSNITIGYMTFLFITSRIFNSLTVIFAVVSFFIKYYDLYLIVLCCEETLTQYDEGVILLREWHNEERSYRCYKLCEEFNLWHSIAYMRINMCGLFNLDKGLAFGILAETIMQSIILIQFDYVFK